MSDIADSAVAVLTTECFDGQAFNLTGPEAISYGQAAQPLSEVIDKPLAFTPIDDKAFIGPYRRVPVGPDTLYFQSMKSQISERCLNLLVP